MGIKTEKLLGFANQLGLQIGGYCDPHVPLEDAADFQAWLDQGYHGEMHYLARNREKLGNPRSVFPEAKSLLIFVVQYHRERLEPLRAGCGRIANFAVGEDYHQLISSKIKEFVKLVESWIERPVKSRVICDAGPLAERALARQAGLGFIGKNNMFIEPGQGSWCFLAELLWDLEVDYEPSQPHSNQCAACEACIRNCPTKALKEKYTLDARNCISYLTIEKKGLLSVSERERLGEWIFGCDVCQQVCPHNKQALDLKQSPDFEKLCPGPCDSQLDLEELLGIRTDLEFKAKYGRTSLMRPGREGMLRNAAVVAGNTGASELADTLLSAAAEDASGVIRISCLWALDKMRAALRASQVGCLREVLKQERLACSPLSKAEIDQYFSFYCS